MSDFFAKITTEGTGDALLYLRKGDNKGTVLLQIAEGEEGRRGLVPGTRYWVEWHFWCAGPATYRMELHGPDCPPFPAIKTYAYDKPHDDEGAFSFVA